MHLTPFILTSLFSAAAVAATATATTTPIPTASPSGVTGPQTCSQWQSAFIQARNERDETRTRYNHFGDGVSVRAAQNANRKYQTVVHQQVSTTGTTQVIFYLHC